MLDNITRESISESAASNHRTYTSIDDVVTDDWRWFTVELFADVAERHPELLTGPWLVLLALLKSDDRMWLNPPGTKGPMDEDRCIDTNPAIDVARLHARWGDLQERVWHAI